MTMASQAWLRTRQYLKYLVYLVRFAGRSPRTLRWHEGRLLIEVTANDLRLLVHPLDHGLAHPLAAGADYERAEVRFLQRRLKAGAVVLDVGANIGYFSLLASGLAGSTGTVIAVEPDPVNFSLLRANIARNKRTNVFPVNCAIGRDVTSAQLFTSTWNFGDHRLVQDPHETRNGVEVKVQTIDNLLAQRGISTLDLIKIDVQGFECEVQAGMSKTLAQATRLVILTEVWPYGLSLAGASAESYCDHYLSHGFQMFRLLDDGREEAFSVHELQLTLAKHSSLGEHFFMNLVFVKGGQQLGR